MLPIETVKYCSAIAIEMLNQLHEQNVIYRDLKPENIMIKRQNGKLVLVDFGFAK
jgi:serine/threonine protein kinase